jgi:cell division protein FtsL
MIRRSTFFATTLAASIGVALFVVKYQVQDLEDQLTMIDHKIVSERQTIHVLKAEWSHLNEPERLRRLATSHLGMVPLDNQQYLVGAKFDQRLSIESDDGLAEARILSFTDRMKKALNEGTER